MSYIISNLLNLFLICLGIYISLSLILSKNPIYCIFHFITIIIILCIFLIGYLNSEYIGLVLVIVYVGAISILFLFIVMLLNIKIIEITALSLSYIPLGLLFSLGLFIQILSIFTDALYIYYLHIYLSNYTYVKNILYENVDTMWYNLDFIDLLVYFISYYFWYQLILIGILLFITMIIVITLTFKEIKYKKTQLMLKQLEFFTKTTIKLKK